MPSIWRLCAGAASTFLLALQIASAWAAPAATQGPMAYRDDRLLVRLSPDVTATLASAPPASAIRRAAPSLDAVARSSGVIGWRARFPRGLAVSSAPPQRLQSFWLADLAPGTDPDEAANRLSLAPGVVSVERIAIVPVTAIPNDSLWSNATHLYQPSRRDVHAPEAWDVTRGDPRIIVAILDTGILRYHPDISADGDPSVDRLWHNEMEVHGLPGVDDDGNGWVDDVVGWDFVALSDSTDVFPGEDWRDEDPDPNDFAGHGTAVAGMVSAIPDNGIGAAGLGWNVRVMALRMGWSHRLAPLGVVDMSDAAAAVDYATRNGAHVINCSFATVTQSDFLAAVDAAIDAGVLIVTSSGNNNSPNSLAHNPEVLAVTATDANDAIPRFATLGDFVDLAAPGNALPTTSIHRPGTDSLGLRQPAYTIGATGTSFSSPLVAAAAALIQSKQLQDGKRLLTIDELRLRLTESTDDIATANPGVTGFGTGRLNAYNALLPGRSLTVRAGSPTVGPAAVIDSWQGEKRIAFAMRSGHLLVLSATGDTLTLAALPGVPVSGISVGDGGGDSGPALFVAVAPGSLASYTTDGRRRDGWPVAIQLRPDGIPLGPAVADLDGDGSQEVVWGSPFSNLAVWRMTGETFPGFPLQINEGHMSPILALGDMDGLPGAEIIAGTDHANRVYVLRHDGTTLSGWPVAQAFVPRSIAVTEAIGVALPRVYIAGGGELRAYHSSGVEHYRRGLTDHVAQDMAIADIDGDGTHEVVLVLTSKADIFDANGVHVVGWPRGLGTAVLGSPVLGPFWGNAAFGIFIASETAPGQLRYQVLDLHGTAAPGFPKPGMPGAWPDVAQLDQDDAPELIVGAGEPGLIYFYDGRPGLWSARRGWPTTRGNASRTSSTAPVDIPKFDDAPPSSASHLSVSADAVDVTLTWQKAADVGPAPEVPHYRVYASPFAVDESNVETSPLIWTVPVAPGADPHFVVPGLARSTPYWFAVRAVDGAGNRAPISNVTSIQAPAPLPGLQLSVLGQPAAGDVRLRWYAAGGAHAPQLVIFDVTGRVVRRIDPGPGFEGEYEWDRRNASGGRVPPGLYFATLKDGAREVRSRIVLLR